VAAAEVAVNPLTIATFLLVIVGAGTLAANLWLAYEAKTSLDQAREDRQLDWAPHLTVADWPHNPLDLIPRVHFREWKVKNVGRGPALNCRVCAWWWTSSPERGFQQRFGLSGVFSLGPIEERGVRVIATDIVASFKGSETWIRGVFGQYRARAAQSGIHLALLCEDQFGGLHNFDPSSSSHRYWHFNRSRGRPLPWVYWPPRFNPLTYEEDTYGLVHPET
jgi:hypothetical protein